MSWILFLLCLSVYLQKVSRFSNIDATCSGSFKVEGLPLHHELPETYDLAEADLLRTHQRFVEEYIKVMKAAIDDELLYEKSDNFVLTRDEDERFSVIKNWFERVYAALTQQVRFHDLRGTIKEYSLFPLKVPCRGLEDNDVSIYPPPPL